MEYSTLSELWKSPEWKAKSKEFSEGKPCAWCDAKPGDTYETRKGNLRKYGFSPHHIEKHKWGLPLYNQVKNQLFREHYKELTSKVLFLYPAHLSKKEHREQEKGKWEKQYSEVIQDHFLDEKKRILNDYLNLSEENALILCTRCHYAREKGMVLCKTCGKSYHKPKYDQCWSCSNLSQQVGVHGGKVENLDPKLQSILSKGERMT